MRLEVVNEHYQKVSEAFLKLSPRDRVIYSLGAAAVTVFGLYFIQMLFQSLSLLGRVGVGLLLTQQKETEAIAHPTKQKEPDKDLEALANHPETLLTLTEDRFPQAKWKAFFECACCPLFNRKESTVRANTEIILIDKIRKKYPLNEKKGLTICSIASGGCFQELVIHAKLTLLGYQITWVLVDLAYFEDGPCKNAAEAFQDFTKKHSPEAQVMIGYDSDETFRYLKEGKLKPDIFLNIHGDLDSAMVTVSQDSEIAEKLPTIHSDSKIKLTRLLAKIEVLMRQIETPYLYLLIKGKVGGTLFDKSPSGLETKPLHQFQLSRKVKRN